MQRGFKLAGMVRDKKLPDRNVFFFKDSEQITVATDDYMNW